MDAEENKAVAEAMSMSVESLSLHSSNLTAVPAHLSSLTALRSLSLRGNRLATLEPSILAMLTRLETLDVSGNALESVPACVGALANLRVLHLEGNRLVALPVEMAALSKLHTLTLAGNEGLPETLRRNVVNNEAECRALLAQIAKTTSKTPQTPDEFFDSCAKKGLSFSKVKDLERVVAMTENVALFDALLKQAERAEFAGLDPDHLASLLHRAIADFRERHMSLESGSLNLCEAACRVLFDPLFFLAASIVRRCVGSANVTFAIEEKLYARALTGEEKLGGPLDYWAKPRGADRTKVVDFVVEAKQFKTFSEAQNQLLLQLVAMRRNATGRQHYFGALTDGSRIQFMRLSKDEVDLSVVYRIEGSDLPQRLHVLPMLSARQVALLLAHLMLGRN